MDGLPNIQSQKIVKKRLDFPLEHKIETMDILLKIRGQKVFETTVKFSI